MWWGGEVVGVGLDKCMGYFVLFEINVYVRIELGV